MTLIERREHERQGPEERRAEHARIKAAADERIRELIAHPGRPA